VTGRGFASVGWCIPKNRHGSSKCSTKPTADSTARNCATNTAMQGEKSAACGQPHATVHLMCRTRGVPRPPTYPNNPRLNKNSGSSCPTAQQPRDSTVQRFNDSTAQRFNALTLQRFNASAPELFNSTHPVHFFQCFVQKFKRGFL
jgi:hypothetical protein